jgi:hypothetical protein
LGKFWMHFILFGSGDTPFSFIICSKYNTSFLRNVHFLGCNCSLCVRVDQKLFLNYSDGRVSLTHVPRYRPGMLYITLPIRLELILSLLKMSLVLNLIQTAFVETRNVQIWSKTRSYMCRHCLCLSDGNRLLNPALRSI